MTAPGPERGRLFRKYFLLILGLVCGALLISGATELYFSYQENRAALLSVQREKAIGAAARIEQFVRQIEQQLALAALPQPGGSIEQRKLEFLKLLRVVPAVTDIAQIDAAGREQLTVSRLAMDAAGGNRDRSQEPAFKNAVAGHAWFSPVYFRKETEPYMTIAVRPAGAAGAVTVAEVNLKFIWDVVTRIKIGKQGKAYVVDGSGHLVADPDIGLVLRKTDLSQLPQVRQALQANAGESFALAALDPSGAPVLTAYASIDPLGWKVFVEQPSAELLDALHATVLRAILLIAAGLVISAFAAMWLARSMVRPIRALQEGAARIGAGDLGQTIAIGTGDELEALAGQFNSMTAQLRESYAKIERLARLKRFVSPRVGELIVAGEVEDPLKTHRRDITVVFTDLRNFTAFSETADPEEVMGVLRDYHATLGRIVHAHEGTVEHFAGDGVMILFNDPMPLVEPELAAVRMALEMRAEVAALAEGWRKRGHELGFGVGIANGYATLGAVGFEGRRDYGAVGPVTNLAARLCSEARAGQILISQRVYGRTEMHIEAEPVGDLSLKGLSRPVPAFNVIGLAQSRVSPPLVSR